MTDINNRSKPLNHRKVETRVGQTYGERRQIQLTQEPSLMDRFFGKGKKSSDINEFSNTTDQYLGSGSRNPTLTDKQRLESGVKAQQHANKDSYLQEIERILKVTTPPPAPKKV